MAKIKTSEQICAIRNLAKKLSTILAWSLTLCKPEITTLEIDQAIEKRMNEEGLRGPCKGYHGFPTVSCISVNNQVTHGIPDRTILNPGDVVDIDLVIEKNGYYADMSRTIGIAQISQPASQLIKITEECLSRGIQAVKPNATLGDIGHAIQAHAERNGYSVVRDYCGHFIGLDMHESPLVQNTGKKGRGMKLEPGMIFCIEPMINQGDYHVLTEGWNATTVDGSLSSRCEHMVLVTAKGHEVLTRFYD